jgi:predicted ATP-grasp superfamily ATP-dependent carboligase
MAKAQAFSNSTPVVIVGGELNGLGVVRSFARQDIPVVVVDTCKRRAALWSRYAKGHLVRSYQGQVFIDDMVALGKSFDNKPLIYLTDEDAVHSVSESREQLAPWFHFRLPDDQSVKMLSNKAKFYQFSLEHRFPVPRTIVLYDRSDLERLCDLRFPCVLKPEDKRDVVTFGKSRAVRVESLHEAIDKAIAMLSSPGAIVAQEWIAGAESNIYFTLFYRGDNGHVASIFTGRKLLCTPADVGSTAVCVAAQEARSALESLTLVFAQQCGFVGMGSIEYKWDDHRQQFVMVEPTVGRTDWQEEVATLNGVNIPLAAYRYELGLPPLPTTETRNQVAWRSTFAQRAPVTLVKPNTRMIDGYFRWRDPMPAVYYYLVDFLLHRLLLWLRTVYRQVYESPKKG